MEREVKFEFYVLNHDFNSDKIFMYNIFNNYIVYEYTLKAVKKYLRSPNKFTYTNHSTDNVLYGYDAFVEELRSIVMWEEWSRVEYEISVGAPFETDCNKLQKVDCYFQFLPNKRLVADHVISQYKKYLKEQKEKKKDLNKSGN